MVPHYSVRLHERALIGCSKAACLFSASDTVAGTVSKSATQRHSYLSLHIYIMPVYGVTSTTCFFLPCASQCRFERCVLEDMPDPSMDASGSQSRANVLTPGYHWPARSRNRNRHGFLSACDMVIFAAAFPTSPHHRPDSIYNYSWTVRTFLYTLLTFPHRFQSIQTALCFLSSWRIYVEYYWVPLSMVVPGRADKIHIFLVRHPS